MSRYIDADDFFRTFGELNNEPYINFPTADVVDRNECAKCVLHPFKQLREQLEKNMVEVVRCKDCKWYDGNECLEQLGLVCARDEDFCSWGERREDGEIH